MCKTDLILSLADQTEIKDEVLYLLLKDRIIDQLINLVQWPETKHVEWIPLAMAAEEKGLTADAVRKQLQNGEFEEGVDFKFKGSRIYVYQRAVERIHRKRRNSNA